MPSDLTAVSLFAGILVGGFDLALLHCGVQVVAAVEIDPDCQGVLARHFPDTKLFGDITEVTGDQLLAAGFVPGRGIFTAGSPCVDFSIAGRRAGLGGARSGLFWHIMRLADELSPRWLLFENVPGLLSAVCSCPGNDTCVNAGRAFRCGRWDKRNGKRTWLGHVEHVPAGGACPRGCMATHGGAMGTVLGAVGKRWDGVAYRVLDSRFFGVAQRRERVFIVGCAGNRAAPAEVLLEPESGAGDIAARGEAGPVAAGSAPGDVGSFGITGALTSNMVGNYDDNTARAGFMVTVPPQDVAGTLGSKVGGSRTTDLDGHGAYVAGVIPIQDGRDMAKAQNGLGVGTVSDPAYTLDTTGAQAVVAWGISSDAVDRSGEGDGSAGQRAGLGIVAEASPAIRARPTNSVAVVAATLQGGGRRGHRIDAEGAAGGHLVVADTLRSHPRPGSNSLGALAPLPSRDVAQPLTSREGKGADSDATSGNLVVTHALTSEGADASEDGTGRGTPLVVVPEPIAFATSSLDCPRDDGLAPPVKANRNGQDTGSGASVMVAVSVAGVSENQRGEVLETPYSRQLTTGGGKPGQGYGAVRVETAVRRLSPRECERLQAFPDDWTRFKLVNGELKELSDSARYRMVGNAVTVSVVQWIGQRIVATDAAERREA